MLANTHFFLLWGHLIVGLHNKLHLTELRLLCLVHLLYYSIPNGCIIERFMW